MTENIIAWRMTPIEGVCRGFTDDPNVAEKWRKAGCVVEPLVLVIEHPRQHLDASKWPSKDDMEAAHAQLSVATGDDDDEFRACQLHWPEPYGSTIGRAADEIDRLRHDIERHIKIASDEAELAEFYANSRPVNEPQQVEVPFANMQFMGGDKIEYAVIRADDWRRFTAALALPRPK